MLLTDLLETLMIVCFGLSWPISIWKSWKSRTAQGKSLIFEVFIEQAACSGSTWGSDFFRECQSVHRSHYPSKSDCKVILMALSKYEGISISQTIKQIDDHAFVTFFKVDAIVGNFNKHL